jgi:selenocysteine-specific elongation factor
VRLGLSPSDVESLVAGSIEEGGVVRIGSRLHDVATVRALAGRLEALVADHHRDYPLEPGAPLQEVRSRLGGDAELVEDVVRRAVAAGALEVEAGVIRARGWSPRPSADQELLRDLLVAELGAAGREPPSVGELQQRHGPAVPSLLRLLERSGALVAVEPDRYYATEAVAGLVEALRAWALEERDYSPAELRDVLGVSRKYLIPFLEFCDRTGVTQRRAGGRTVVGARGLGATGT